MGDACCSERPGAEAERGCPKCGQRGRSVEWQTVAALLSVPVPPRQDFGVCEDSDCPVVYFGEMPGSVYRSDALNVSPGFKNGGGDALLCYCFDKRRRDIEQDLRTSGDTAASTEIQAAIRAQACACEVRNPTGRCCLGTVNAEIEAARRRVENRLVNGAE